MQKRILLPVFALFVLVLSAAAQGTAFTYQGRLQESGQAPTGTYDFDFRVFDGAHAGGPVGGPYLTNAVMVTEGQFSVTLDFGPGVFTGAPRWLQIRVRPSGSEEDFTELRPRQLLSATPYALTASNLSGTLPAAQISGLLISEQLAGLYSNAVSFVHGSNWFQGTFVGDGSGLTNVNVSGSPTQNSATKILWVAPWGDDGRALRGVPDRPWATWSNAVAAAGHGDVVRILPGRYTNAHRSDLQGGGEANVLIVGKTNFVIEGIGLPTLYNPTTATMIAVVRCSNVIVRGLSLESEHYNAWTHQPLPGGVFGHLAYADVEWLTIEDCTFSKGTDHGVLELAGWPATFPSTNHIVIRNNRFSHFGFYTGGFWPAGWWDGAAIVCGAAWVTGNDISHVARGIEVYPIADRKTPHAVIENNRIWNTLDFGINMVSASSLSVVRNNVIFNEPDFTLAGSAALASGAGIEVSWASDCVVSGNFIRRKPVGVAVFGEWAHRNRVLRNTVLDCQWGITVSGGLSGDTARLASNNVITANFLANLDGSGIAVYRGAGTLIQHNTLLDPGLTWTDQYGIRIFGESVNTIVSDNTVAVTGPASPAAGLAFHNGATNGALAAGNRCVGLATQIEGAVEVEDMVRMQNGLLALAPNSGLAWPGVQLTADAVQGGAWNVTNMLFGERGAWGVTLSARTPGQLEVWDAAGPDAGSLARIVAGSLQASTSSVVRLVADQVEASTGAVSQLLVGNLQGGTNSLLRLMADSAEAGTLSASQLIASNLWLPGHGAASNAVWTCADPLTGAGEWRPLPLPGPEPLLGLTNVVLRTWTNAGPITWKTNALSTADGETVFISFSNRTVQWLSFTNTTITLATTNRDVEGHREVELWLCPTGEASSHTVSFPPAWRRFSGLLKNNLSKNKLAVVRLRLLAGGGDESTVAAWWEVEQ
jgi:hypothetical protein